MQSRAREAYDHALSMIREGAARKEILSYLANTAEKISMPGSAASILVLDEAGLLRNGASPSIPADYLNAIDRLKPDAKVGTCAAAAATGQVVVTPDFTADGKWAELKHLPLSLGYVGAWSTPIKDDNGRVVGTFGVYHRQSREPSKQEREAMSVLAAAAARAITQLA